MEKELVDGVRKLTVNLHPYRYHGKSSGLVFIRSALDLKTEMDGPRLPRKPRPGPESAVSSQDVSSIRTLSDTVFSGCKSLGRMINPRSTRAVSRPKT